jgi:hypothetical protein
LLVYLSFTNLPYQFHVQIVHGGSSSGGLIDVLSDRDDDMVRGVLVMMMMMLMMIEMMVMMKIIEIMIFDDR